MSEKEESLLRIKNAALQLAKSDRGKAALRDLLAMLENGAIALDDENTKAILVLFVSAFSGVPGTVREEIENALEK